MKLYLSLLAIAGYFLLGAALDASDRAALATCEARKAQAVAIDPTQESFYNCDQLLER